jgi:hypothetical protein
MAPGGPPALDIQTPKVIYFLILLRLLAEISKTRNRFIDKRLRLPFHRLVASGRARVELTGPACTPHLPPSAPLDAKIFGVLHRDKTRAHDPRNAWGMTEPHPIDTSANDNRCR